MSREVKQIITPQQLSVGVATLYTVPVNRSTVITRITFTNTTSNDVRVNLWLVPSGGTAQDENQILTDLAIAAGESFSAADVEGQVLPTNNTIRANAETGAAVTIIGSGTEITQ